MTGIASAKELPAWSLVHAQGAPYLLLSCTLQARNPVLSFC